MTDERGRVGGKAIHEELEKKKELERLINEAFRATFETENGKKVITYLKNMTINNVPQPDVSNDDLRFAHGKKWLVLEILDRIERGKHKDV